MQLSPHEQERLLVHIAADVATRRQKRGLKLNYPEAVAVLTTWVFEAARDGLSVADIMSAGREVLTTDDVMSGIGSMLDELQVEATFPDGTKLVTLHGPIGPGTAPDELAVHEIVPGEVIVDGDPIQLFVDAALSEIEVENIGDRPIQVGSHFHFAEVNEALRFGRDKSIGKRLAIPAGTSVRFEPGVPMTVLLVELGGDKVAAGFRGLYSGPVGEFT